jgi:hypothetical protein
MKELEKNELMGVDGGSLWGLLGDFSLFYDIAVTIVTADAQAFTAYTDFTRETGGYYVTHITR